MNLHLKSTTLQGDGSNDRLVEKLAQALSTNNTVKKLRLRSIHFRAPEFKALADGLSSNATIEHLDINQFSLMKRVLMILAGFFVVPACAASVLSMRLTTKFALLCAALKKSPVTKIGLSKSFIGERTAHDLILLLKENREINNLTISQSFVSEEDLELMVNELSKISG